MADEQYEGAGLAGDSVGLEDAFKASARSGAGGSERLASPVRSSAAGSGSRGDNRAGRAGATGFTREAEPVKVLAGKQFLKPDPRKYRYDVIRGNSSGLPFETSKEDRLSAVDAGAMLHRIHELFGLVGEADDVLASFDNALWFSHTINGGSVLIPGRSEFSVVGKTRSFSYAHVRDALGVDNRRFFRAFADDIAEANRRVLRNYDPANPVAVEQYAWLTEVAQDRGMQRYPWLAHDSASACSGLDMSQRAAISASKVGVLSTSANSADRLFSNSRTMGADKFDSTTHTTI